MRSILLSQPDTEIHGLLAAGDSRGLELLYDRYAGFAFSVALRITADQGRAEEVVQDAFVTVWRRVGSYDPARGTLRTWLLTVVRNRAIDVVRGNRAPGRTASELPEQLRDTSRDSDPWQQLSQSLERDAVQAALAILPEDQRRAIELAYFGGHTHSEIATMLSVPLGTVKGRLRLGMEKMHSFLIGRGVTTG